MGGGRFSAHGFTKGGIEEETVNIENIEDIGARVTLSPQVWFWFWNTDAR